jgi:inhibitor of cysteine peptidase
VRLVTLLAMALTLAGCGSDAKHPATTTIDVSYDDLLSQQHISRDVNLGEGDILRISLASNASTGYRWAEQAQISDRAVVVQRDHYYGGPPDIRPPGTSGVETWTFEALESGTATIATTYSQPWPGGAEDAWTFSATVRVR